MKQVAWVSQASSSPVFPGWQPLSAMAISGTPLLMPFFGFILLDEEGCRGLEPESALFYPLLHFR